MKVLFISSDNNRSSGAFRCMVQMIDILQRNHRVEALVVLPKNGDGEELLVQKDIRYIKIYAFSWIIKNHVRSLKDLLHNMLKIFLQPYNRVAISKLKRLIKKEQVELVHVNTIYAHYGAIAAYQCGIKVIWHIREFLEEDQNASILFRKKGYQLINRADAVITVSDQVFQKYKRYISEKKLSRIYEGVNEQEYRIDNKEILVDDTIHMIMIGNLSEGKGQKILIEALKNIDVAYELFLLGTGDRAYVKKLKTLIDQYQESEKIIFCGKADNVKEYLEKTDIAFVCSQAEAFGRVTVEAMLAGNIVIGADAGCTSEIIRHEKNGILFHCGDVEDLNRKINYVTEHRKLCRQIAKRAQEEVVEKYLDVRNADLVYQTYLRVFKFEKRCEKVS